MVTESELVELVDRRWGDLLDLVGRDNHQRYVDGETMPRRYLRMAGEAQLSGMAFPTRLGGGGADLRTWGLIMEEIAFRCAEPAFPIVLSMGTGVASLLAEAGRADLVEHYVKPIIAGRRTATLAFSEDSDAFSMQTTVRRDGAEYLVSGTKDYITGALIADVFLTYARGETGALVGCLVHSDDPGVEIVPVGGIGFRTSGMGRLVMRDVRLVAARVVAVDGLSHSQSYLNLRRLILACLVTGMTRAVFDRCVARLRTAVRHGAPVIDLPNVQGAIGRMCIAIEANRALLHATLGKADAGRTDRLFDVSLSAAKHFATEQALFVADQALRVLGGHGYYGDYHYGMFLRDCVGLLCAAGTQETLEINIGMLAATRELPYPLAIGVSP
ncbi:acyl-CoA dehydrogenase family protein [Nocardia sp. XZ_19_369]|uniref:acyl-CoA dehydrogenase family protein n=1 Tax=Nocardia sp. XZ_19_369 TaxID=2769487 RepID=UPI00188EAF16|nr:acyl-CoA dehydrogenase family protein [Nocardia sp. XZ_19_369]